MVLLAVAFAFIALRSLRRLLAVRAGTWLRVLIDGSMQELPTVVPRWRQWISGPSKLSVREVDKILKHAATDPKITGILLEIHSLEAGWATLQTLRSSIERARASGRRIVAWLPYGAQNKSLILATAAAEIYAPPPASIGPLGLAIHSQFYRRALARIGIEAEVLARREFKSAAESFTSDAMSDPNRLQTTALADEFYGQVVRSLVEGRAMTEDAAKEFIDATPVRAREAAERGVISKTLYEDELLAMLGQSEREPSREQKSSPTQDDTVPPVMEAVRYAKLRLRKPRRWAQRGPRVGVVLVHGPIVLDSPANARVASVRSVVSALRAAEKDPNIAAVVLSIDSPGGSALASDHMAREVQRLAKKKPVIAYFGNVAASGGYYVGALAKKIVAQRSTITGSIGVVAMRFVIGEAMEKVSIAHSVIVRGARSELFSPYRKWNDDERIAMDREIDGVYEDFVNIVARGRGKTFEQIEPLARGRVYTGAEAKQLGLVDEMGDLSFAVKLAAEEAKIATDRDPVLVPGSQEWTPPESPAALATVAIESAIGARAAAWWTFARQTHNEYLFLLDGELGWEDFGG